MTQVKSNIDSLLNEETFTLITAHQPCLFTGPLYFIYKICSAINLSRQLNREFSENHFVPVFITGGEDHDFEEMNHLNIYGRKIEWNHPKQGGPVGRMSLDNIQDSIEELDLVLGKSDNANEIMLRIKKYFSGNNNYGSSLIEFVDSIFSSYGLVICNMDQRNLKKAFIPIMEDELVNNSSFNIVPKTQLQLKEIGFGEQAHVRPINLFYLGENSRTRIIKEANEYYIADKKYTESEILELLHAEPENFSPNVVLRPIYQELILPNLAYIGGGGEIAYWLERKAQFAHYKIPFPMLIRRNSALYLSKSSQKLINKTGLSLEQIFTNDLEYFLAQWVKNQSDISVDDSKEKILAVLDEVGLKAAALDSTLKNYVGAEATKIGKLVDNIGKRMLKSAKSKQEITINRIKKLYDNLFPLNSLQERKENFLPMYVDHGKAFVDYLIEEFDPLDKQFIIISE